MGIDETTVVPTERELHAFELNDPATVELIARAQQAVEADRKLTIMQALKKYKTAVFWAMILSWALVMEGYDVVVINSFFGQTQFKNRFGTYDEATDSYLITAPWQSGLANSALVGQVAGLAINAYAQDRFGCRRTTMVFMVWMIAAIFIPFFAPSLAVLAFGEAMCGIAWGVFQTLTTTYACELVPIVLRPYVTSYVCMCWGIGICISSGVIRAVANVQGDLGWRLPFALQWVWPVPLFLVAYFAPEFPWNSVRRNNIEEARRSLERLAGNSDHKQEEVEATLAYIRYTTEMERAESEGASFLDCFRGTNLRRTEINCVVWAAQILCGNPLLSYAVVFLQAVGFDEIQAFNTNIALSVCIVAGVFICWFLFPHFGRATIYMSGLSFIFLTLVIIGGLAFHNTKGSQMAQAIMLILSTLVNYSTLGPGCYPIVSETPSGRLRYKTIAIGRFIYNLTNVFQNVITPRMLSPTAWNWGGKAALFYAGTNLLCNIWCWFRLPETKGRSFGEIDLLFEHKISARKFKSVKVDQFAHQTNYEDKLELNTAASHVE
ncbi:general substrate transporter [Fusarium redolens]|uniref:General substrate transporter n=1 Tax=Fusarium redolens TaxID=48865 RepID=A0A9P9JLD7_FUSRE|nr:general substrate transporter [Fusarium redolens]KAH7222649.1 general substrate transporter [Fusarium redolens]